MDCDLSVFDSMQDLTIMDPDNAIYEDIKDESSHGGFDIQENECYGKVTSGSTAVNKHEEKWYSYSKVTIMAFVIVLALLLGTAGACVAFAVQITTLKSEIASIKMVSFTSLEEVGHQLNTSVDTLYQQQNASLDSVYQQLNMLYQQQNASLDSVYQQLNMLYQQQNASLDSVYQQLSMLYQQQNASIDSVYQQLNISIDILYQQLNQQNQQLKQVFNPFTSCKDLYDTHNASSGYYWIGEIWSSVRVYCNMSLTCGNLTGGWMRVANIDMTNTSQSCPNGLSLTSSPKRVCDITSSGCVSNNFDVYGVQYSHICGRVIGYQKSALSAFNFHSRGIDADYVYGVSLTHGQSPRQHIWTFAGAVDETAGSYSWSKCPCVNPNLDPTPTLPDFIGNDYFCDTALETSWDTVPNYRSIQVSDPLWDGEGCGPTSTCCHDQQRNVNPPWFVKTLSSPTSDDIEMRLCAPYGGSYTTPIEIVELYVQ